MLLAGRRVLGAAGSSQLGSVEGRSTRTGSTGSTCQSEQPNLPIAANARQLDQVSVAGARHSCLSSDRWPPTPRCRMWPGHAPWLGWCFSAWPASCHRFWPICRSCSCLLASCCFQAARVVLTMSAANCWLGTITPRVADEVVGERRAGCHGPPGEPEGGGGHQHAAHQQESGGLARGLAGAPKTTASCARTTAAPGGAPPSWTGTGVAGDEKSMVQHESAQEGIEG